MERFFIHKDLLEDSYLKEVAIKKTETLPSGKELKGVKKTTKVEKELFEWS